MLTTLESEKRHFPPIFLILLVNYTREPLPQPLTGTPGLILVLVLVAEVQESQENTSDVQKPVKKLNTLLKKASC